MAQPPRRPRNRLLWRLLGAGVLAIVVVILVVYFVVFPTSSPKPFKLGSTGQARSTSAPGSTAPSAGPTSNAELDGGWRITSGSQAGYRVREKLAFLPAQSDAVGRTSDIDGTATLSESAGTLKIAAASFSVAVSTLKSDRSMRDEKIHSIGLESDRYPTATFKLDTPVSVSTGALRGRVAHVSVTGTFVIHGTSKKVSLPVELSLAGATLEAAGALTFPWSEFGMSAPSVGGFVNVTERATMEFDLHLQRA